jgi:hypothetical protein
MEEYVTIVEGESFCHITVTEPYNFAGTDERKEDEMMENEEGGRLIIHHKDETGIMRMLSLPCGDI